MHCSDDLSLKLTFSRSRDLVTACSVRISFKMVVCSVAQCSNSSTTCNYSNKGITFHRFPLDPELKEKWISATGKLNWFPTQNSRLCSMHFTKKCYITTSKRRNLTKTAVPTINVWKLIDINWNMDGTLQNNSSVKVKEDDDSLISEPEIKSEIVISENEFSVDEPAAKLRKTPDTASTSGVLNTSVRSNEDEECTIFGNYVGSQLKKMSSETRTLCQLNIQKLISEALLNEIHAGSTAFRIDVVNTTGAIQIKEENPDD